MPQRRKAKKLLHQKLKGNRKLALALAFLLFTLVVHDQALARHEVKDVYRKQRWTVTAAPEHAPLKGKSVPAKTSIKWGFSDVNPDETGFAIHDQNHKVLATTLPVLKQNLTSLEETGLSEGVEYCGRHVHALNNEGESPASDDLPCTRTLDSVAPVISDIKIEAIAETLATILWRTDIAENTNDIVYYWKEASSYLYTTGTASGTTEHSVKLTKLATGTLYTYLVSTTDPGGNEGRSESLTFTTAGAPKDTKAPILVDIQVKDIKGSGATVVWNTDEQTQGWILYGLTADKLIEKLYSQKVGISHSVDLQGLKAGTKYYYAVKSKDAEGNEAASEARDFTTLAIVPPKILKSAVSKITGKEASLAWETDKVTQGSVLVLKEGASQPDQVSYNKTAKQHSLKLGKLASGTKYQVAVYVLDPITGETARAVLSFKTTGKKK